MSAQLRLVSLNSLPAEILHNICCFLPQKDIRSVRMANKKLAIIGTYYLLSDVSFFLSGESLERLHDIALHPILSQKVKSLHYQANVLQEIKSPRYYKELMNNKHRHGTRPNPPGPNATEREVRLFLRNEAKWRRGNEGLSTRQISSKMKAYASIYAAQQEVINSCIEETILADAIGRFINLKSMVFTTRPTCCHAYSDRFMERFKDLQITPPTKPDTAQTVLQLAHYLNPLARSSIQLENFGASYISPETLRLPSLSKQLSTLKDSLVTIKECSLSFKLDAQKTERLHDASGPEVCFGVLERGGLPLLLSHMPKLRTLCVSFDDCPCSTRVSLDHILGSHEWPDLQNLSLAQFSATEESLITCLVRHSDSLDHVRFSNAVLTHGSWVDVTRKMRTQLCLSDALFTEVLRNEATGEHWDMRSVDLDTLDIGPETLSECLNYYICSGLDDDDFMDDVDSEDLDFEFMQNPLMDENTYVHPDDLEDEDIFQFFAF